MRPAPAAVTAAAIPDAVRAGEPKAVEGFKVAL